LPDRVQSSEDSSPQDKDKKKKKEKKVKDKKTKKSKKNKKGVDADEEDEDHDDENMPLSTGGKDDDEEDDDDLLGDLEGVGSLLDTDDGSSKDVKKRPAGRGSGGPKKRPSSKKAADDSQIPQACTTHDKPVGQISRCQISRLGNLVILAQARVPQPFEYLIEGGDDYATYRRPIGIDLQVCLKRRFPNS